MASGIVPDNLFMDRLSAFRPFTFFRVGGMDPWNELLSSKSCCSTVQSPIFSGISPVHRFPDRYRLLRFLKLPTSDGRGPDNELWDKSKYIERTGSLKCSLGIEPFRWFLDKSRSVRLFSSSKLDGIAPSKLPLFAYSLVNCDRFPIDEGMIPEK